MKGVPRSRADLAAQYALARAAWPQIEVTLDWFFTHARAVAALEILDERPADFYLACAAARGNAAAIGAIECEYLTRAANRLRHRGASTDDVDEALQVTRERLFVGPNPKISAYTGATPLAQWVQLVALRAAIDLRRSRGARPEQPNAVPNVEGAVSPGPDPAATLLKRTYRVEFERALQTEIRALEPRDRTILRLYLLEGVSVEKIATMRDVHRVTVARWLWRASEQMLTGVRRYFRDHHGLVPKECDSLVNLVRSQLTLDWSHIFDASQDAPPATSARTLRLRRGRTR
ncbi:MAG TPA: sigma factor-like helix-turn-helix DNA-binding protein [Polyangia bacterium]|nr:sigma factor-like helix-turn-helix DNA-binding protein [Polyangia bacterium]